MNQLKKSMICVKKKETIDYFCSVQTDSHNCHHQQQQHTNIEFSHSINTNKYPRHQIRSHYITSNYINTVSFIHTWNTKKQKLTHNMTHTCTHNMCTHKQTPTPTSHTTEQARGWEGNKRYKTKKQIWKKTNLYMYIYHTLYKWSDVHNWSLFAKVIALLVKMKCHFFLSLTVHFIVQ